MSFPLAIVEAVKKAVSDHAQKLASEQASFINGVNLGIDGGSFASIT